MAKMPYFPGKRTLCRANLRKEPSNVSYPEHLRHPVGGALATHCTDSMPICAHVSHVVHMHGSEWAMSQITRTYRHAHARRHIPSSQASFCEAQTSLSLHTSILHSEQPSQVFLLPSSHFSPKSTTPLPHSSIRHIALQPSPSMLLPARMIVSRRMYE
jgi:hypothetical protein